MLRKIIEKRAQKLTLGHPSGMYSQVGGQLSLRPADEVTPEVALTTSAVYSAVKIIGETMATLPLPVKKRDGKNTVEAVDHPAWELLNGMSNPEQTAREWRELMGSWAALRGTAYSEIEYNRNREPIALWPLPADSVQPYRANDNAPLQYKIRLNSGGGVIVDSDRILKLIGFSWNGVEGVDIVRYFAQSIGVSLNSERFADKFYENGSMAGGILSYPGVLGADAKKNLKESWEYAHRGLENAHRVAILEGGMKWEKLTVDNDAAQFIETRKFQVTEFARIFRIPPHMLADLDRATFSNIEQQGIDFVTYSLMPWLTRFEKRLEASLLTPSERKSHFIRHMVQALMRGDNASRSAFYQSAILTGWMSRNEARELEDMNPVEDADELFIPSNVQTDSSMGDQSDAEDVPADDSMDSADTQARSWNMVYRTVLAEVAAREKADLCRAYDKRGSDPVKYAESLASFTASHPEYIRRKLAPVITAYADCVGMRANVDAVVDGMMAIPFDGDPSEYMASRIAQYGSMDIRGAVLP